MCCLSRLKNRKRTLVCIFLIERTSLFTQFAPDKVQREEEVVKTLQCAIQQHLGCGFQTELNIHKAVITNNFFTGV